MRHVSLVKAVMPRFLFLYRKKSISVSGYFNACFRNNFQRANIPHRKIVFFIRKRLFQSASFSSSIFSADVAVVGQVNSPFEPVVERKRLRMRHGAVINHDCIEFISRFEASDLSKEGTSAFGGEKEGFRYGEGMCALVNQTPVQL